MDREKLLYIGLGLLGIGLLVGGAVTGTLQALIKKLIAGIEGFSATPYLDPPGNTKGQYSIGYGHLIVPGDPYWPYGTLTEIDEAQASAQFDQDTATARDAVTRYVKVTLTDNQFAALTSFTFNEGVTAFKNSNLLKKLNAGDYVGAAAEFDLWVYVHDAKNQKVQADYLVKRRTQEKELFLSDVQVA